MRGLAIAGLMAVLTRKAEGLRDIVASAGGNPQLASLLMATEQLPSLVESHRSPLLSRRSAILPQRTWGRTSPQPLDTNQFALCAIALRNDFGKAPKARI